jgi:hypothetical protein
VEQQDARLSNSNNNTSLHYNENGRLVFTELYHLERGFCCGSGCRHCPYIPKWEKGSIKTKK